MERNTTAPTTVKQKGSTKTDRVFFLRRGETLEVVSNAGYTVRLENVLCAGVVPKKKGKS